MKLFVIGSICLLLAVMVIACQNQKSIDYNRLYAEGSQVYQSRCQNCHGEKGEGLAALIPPLRDAVVLKKLPCVVKSGLQGKITVSGRQFEGNMPAVDLTPIEIAQVAVYVSNSFGNKSGFASEDDVDKVLSACK
jgi:mono/diheme cytochrome c family protein